MPKVLLSNRSTASMKAPWRTRRVTSSRDVQSSICHRSAGTSDTKLTPDERTWRLRIGRCAPCGKHDTSPPTTHRCSFTDLDRGGGIGRAPGDGETRVENRCKPMARAVPYSKTIVEETGNPKCASNSVAKLVAPRESRPASISGVSSSKVCRPVARCADRKMT
eukprot:scaffold20734_cov118-Isochrysis_galbana.AAC.5